MGRSSSHALLDGLWATPNRTEEIHAEILLNVYDSDSAVLKAPGVWKLSLGEALNAGSDMASCILWARSRGVAVTLHGLSDLIERSRTEVFIENSVIELLHLLDIEAPDEIT